MDKLPVGQLPDLQQSNNDDEIMVITNSEYSQLKKEKISDLITDFTSTNENNALTKGTDGKMFVTDFGNASNITEGTLQTSVLPQIPTEKLPQTGVEAGEYSYPSSVTVNAHGQITAIEEGQTGANNANQDLSNLSPEGEKHFLNKTQITNCMLEAPNGIATYSGTSVTVQEGTNYLFPNGRNSNNTLQNTTFTAASNITGTISGSTAGTFVVFVTSESSLIFANNINYFITSTEPTALNDTTSQGVWYNPDLNTLSQCAATSSTPSWSTFEGARCVTLTYDGSAITAFNPVYPVELLKKSDLQETLANVDLSNLSEAGKKVFDGQWVSKLQSLTAITSGSVEVDLSEYLPVDEYNYEIMLTFGALNHFSTTQANMLITSSIITNVGAYSYTSQGARISGQYIIAVGADRKIKFAISGAAFNETLNYAIAYRRLGTNE